MGPQTIKIAIYIVAYASAMTLFMGGTEYLGFDSNSGFSVAQIFIEAGLCFYICRDLSNAADFVKANPKASTSAMMRYAFLIGFPMIIAPMIAVWVLLALGQADLLQSGPGFIFLMSVSGLVYLVAALLFGLAVPGSLKDPKDTIGMSVRRSGRQFGYLLSRFLFLMVPFGIGAVVLPLLAINSGHMSADVLLDPASLAIYFVARILAGISVLGFCAAVVSALRFDMEEQQA